MNRALTIAPWMALVCLTARAQTNDELRDQVRKTEIDFAKTMADRNHAVFVAFLAEETVFFGPAGPRRGKAQVAEAWKPYYDGKEAPFSWAPESVEVLGSGTLGFSSGPVWSPAGRRIGTFHSVWRREGDGRWRIVLDKGCPPCDCPPADSREPGSEPRTRGGPAARPSEPAERRDQRNIASSSFTARP